MATAKIPILNLEDVSRYLAARDMVDFIAKLDRTAGQATTTTCIVETLVERAKRNKSELDCIDRLLDAITLLHGVPAAGADHT